MTIQFHVPDMTCGHCVQTITRAVQAAAPDAQVQTDLDAHRVSIESSAQAQALAQVIRDAGYEVQTLGAV